MKKKTIAWLGLPLGLLCASCTSLPPEQVAQNEQTRFKEQMKGYPDRESPQQQKADAEKARKESMLKKK